MQWRLKCSVSRPVTPVAVFVIIEYVPLLQLRLVLTMRRIEKTRDNGYVELGADDATDEGVWL